MEFFDIINSRGSYRNEFLAEEVKEEDLKKILDAGIKAPSRYNLQTTSFIAVRNPEIRTEIAGILPTPATKTAPVIIVVLSERNDSQGGLSFEIEDYGAATENIMLAITALGYAGVWMNGMVRIDGAGEKLAKLLHVLNHKTIQTIIPVGKPAKEVTKKQWKSASLCSKKSGVHYSILIQQRRTPFTLSAFHPSPYNTPPPPL